MSKFLKSVAASALLISLAAPASAQFGLGREATPDEVAAWDIDIRPDGGGLPEGSGDVLTGEEVYLERCAVCHGDFGEAVGRWPVLAGGHDSLDSEDPVKTIGSYWPYLSTVWDYVHRAMPFGDAQSLTDDEVYAITAYLMYLNDLVDDDFELSKDNFLEVPLPNEANFFMDDRADTETGFKEEPCMSNCKENVEITKRARVIDVTPEEETAEAASEEASAATNAAATETETAEASEETTTEVAAVDPEMLEKGEKVFKKCKACHQVGEGATNKTGPILNGVLGQTVGGVEGFKYSKPMKEAAEGGMVWDDATLAAFLKKPKDVIPRTKMSFAGLKKDADIEAVIAYIKANAL